MYVILFLPKSFSHPNFPSSLPLRVLSIMGDDEFCNTKLALGIGNSSGNSMPKLDKRGLSLDLSLIDEGQSSRNSEDYGGESRKKLRLSKEQSAVLEDRFKEHTTLNTAQKNDLAVMLGLKPRQVEVWFQNRRARTKLKQTETDCELWKNNCESLKEENCKLKKEIEELKALRAAFYAQLTNCVGISVCPSCKKVEGVPSNKGSGDRKHIERTATAAAAAAAAVAAGDVVQNHKYK